MSISHCYCSDYMTKPTQFGDEPYLIDNDSTNNPLKKVGQELGQCWVKKWVKTSGFKNTRLLNLRNSAEILFYKVRNKTQKMGQKWVKEWLFH